MFFNKYTSIATILLIFCASCVEIDTFDNSKRGNFEALWKIMDERYCFFDEKGVDWNEIHDEYAAKIRENMSQEELFYVLDSMLQTLKDGHVNLISPFDLGRYWKWFEDYPANFKSELVEEYLGYDYRIAGGLRYKILVEDEDSIGYLRYASFSSSFSKLNLDYVIDHFRSCKGIIIDVRNNGGGLLTNSEELASRFFSKSDTVGYIQHKTGKGHNDFSKLVVQTITPSDRLRYPNPTIVLTNRSCFSATNDFVNSMRYAPNVRILGDRTGGGSGLPFSSELPNGWSVRFSACPSFDRDKNSIESGIEPCYKNKSGIEHCFKVNLSEEDALSGRDSMIEAARTIILSLYKKDE